MMPEWWEEAIDDDLARAALADWIEDGGHSGNWWRTPATPADILTAIGGSEVALMEDGMTGEGIWVGPGGQRCGDGMEYGFGLYGLGAGSGYNLSAWHLMAPERLPEQHAPEDPTDLTLCGLGWNRKWWEDEMPKIGLNQLIVLPHGWVICGFVARQITMFVCEVENASVICNTGGVSWDALADGQGRENARFRKWGTVTVGPNYCLSREWKGELP